MHGCQVLNVYMFREYFVHKKLNWCGIMFVLQGKLSSTYHENNKKKHVLQILTFRQYNYAYKLER